MSVRAPGKPHPLQFLDSNLPRRQLPPAYLPVAVPSRPVPCGLSRPPARRALRSAGAAQRPRSIFCFSASRACASFRRDFTRRLYHAARRPRKGKRPPAAPSPGAPAITADPSVKTHKIKEKYLWKRERKILTSSFSFAIICTCVDCAHEGVLRAPAVSAAG